MSVRAARKRFLESCRELGIDYIPKRGTQQRLDVQVLVLNHLWHLNNRRKRRNRHKIQQAEKHGIRKRLHRYRVNFEYFISERLGISKQKHEVTK